MKKKKGFSASIPIKVHRRSVAPYGFCFVLSLMAPPYELVSLGASLTLFTTRSSANLSLSLKFAMPSYSSNS